MLAFDTGPGNMVIDRLAWLASRRRLRYDRDGKLAGRGRVNETLLAAVSPSGQGKSGRLSSEWPLHFAVYRRDPGVGAIVHAHPPCATALACSLETFDTGFLSEAVMSLGEVPVVPYEMPSSETLADAVAAALRNRRAALLANHGAVTVGPDIRTAFYRMESLEHSARIFLNARILGGARRLDDEEIAALLRLAEGYALADNPGYPPRPD